MHRHRELCERAVDPLEIAAGLEAHGVTDRTAARFRHRDVFSLAEEMYARVPRGGDDAPADPAAGAGPPGACRLGPARPPARRPVRGDAVAGIRLTDGQSRLVAALVGVLAVALAVRAALSRGPLGTRRPRTHAPAPPPVTYWLLAYALLGDGLLAAAVTGGPDACPPAPPTPPGPWPPPRPGPDPVLRPGGLVRPPLRGTRPSQTDRQPRPGGLRRLRTAPAARHVRPVPVRPDGPAGPVRHGPGRTRRRRPDHHPGRPALPRPPPHRPRLHPRPGAGPHRRRDSPGDGPGRGLRSRLPGCGFLATPVEALVDLWGAGGIQTLSCGIGALALLIHAIRKLTRASAHAQPEDAVLTRPDDPRRRRDHPPAMGETAPLTRTGRRRHPGPTAGRNSQAPPEGEPA